MERGSIYPSWRYHRTAEPCLVHTSAEDDALGEGWSDRDIRGQMEAAEEPADALGCEDHPRYQGKSAPREDCAACQAIYAAVNA